MRLTILLPLAFLLGLGLSCNNPTPSVTCADGTACGHSSVCQAGVCVPESKSQCKKSLICGTAQACANGSCKTNSCSTSLDCTDVYQTCQNGVCATQTIFSCSTNSICTANKAITNLACVTKGSSCGCATKTDCGGATPACDGGTCKAAQQTCTGTGSGTKGCSANQVCVNGSCKFQTALNCLNSSICSPGQTCTTATGANTASCQNVPCTTTAQCAGGSACIASICQANTCTGSGVGNCTDPSQTCQSGSCLAQTSSNCRSGYPGCSVSGDTCATGVCACVAGTSSGCSSSDICVNSKCQAQTATSCLAGGTWCAQNDSPNETCNASGVCACGSNPSCGGATPYCSSAQQCIPANRYVFITALTFIPGANPFTKGGDTNCQQDVNGKVLGSTINYAAVLGSSTYSIFEHLPIRTKNEVKPITLTDDQTVVSSSYPSSTSSTCGAASPSFDCIAKWNYNFLGAAFISGANPSGDFFSINSSQGGPETCSDWTNLSQQVCASGGGYMGWCAFSLLPCNQALPLLCLEID